MTNVVNARRKSFFRRLLDDMRVNWILYVLILPVFVYYIIFAYAPMYGIQLAFKDYRIKLGIMGSPWVGLEHFERFFSAYNFRQLLFNTLGISVYSLIAGFPIPIIFALMLNYLISNKLRKVVQMVSYAPYFISTVVICGMLTIFLDTNSGIFNVLRGLLGMEPVNALGKPEWFKSIYVWSGVWQGMGYSAVIYIAALANVDSAQVEASLMDGAGRFARVWHVDLPAILPTIVIQLILAVGSVMSLGYEKVFLMQNPVNTEVSEVISTFVYKRGIAGFQYSYAAAVGLFNSVVNLVLIALANVFAKKVGETSLW